MQSGTHMEAIPYLQSLIYIPLGCRGRNHILITQHATSQRGFSNSWKMKLVNCMLFSHDWNLMWGDIEISFSFSITMRGGEGVWYGRVRPLWLWTFDPIITSQPHSYCVLKSVYFLWHLIHFCVSHFGTRRAAKVGISECRNLRWALLDQTEGPPTPASCSQHGAAKMPAGPLREQIDGSVSQIHLLMLFT